MRKVLSYILTAIMALTLFWGYKVAFWKSEAIECEQWMASARVNHMFYLVDWQVDQCEAHGFDVSWIRQW